MYSSAIRSSSPVVIPGSRCSPTFAIVSATTRPAAAILAISWADLRMIIAVWPLRYRERSRSRRRRLRRAARVQRHELPGRAVVLDRPVRSARGRRRAGERSTPACRRFGLRGWRARARAPWRSRRRDRRRRRRRAVRPISSSISSSASACARFRGNPSRMNPSRASSSANRSRIIRIIISSGTRSPRSMISLTSRPSGVDPSRARSISPVDTCGRPCASATRFACVPFPDPCGPSTRTFTT